MNRFLSHSKIENRRSKSFTLIELLVVVAIIAVLISILLPALAKAREQARRTVCLANLHQWAILLSIYATDNREHYPPAAKGSPTTLHPQYATFPTGTGEMQRWPFYVWATDPHTAAFFTCPNLAVLNYPPMPPTIGWAGYDWIEMGYTYCGDGSGSNLRWPGWTKDMHKPRGPSDPGEWNLMNDFNNWVNYYGPWQGRQVAHLRQGGGTWGRYSGGPKISGDDMALSTAGGNQLFNDGSAMWADFKKLTIVFNTGSEWYFWLYR